MDLLLKTIAIRTFVLQISTNEPYPDLRPRYFCFGVNLTFITFFFLKQAFPLKTILPCPVMSQTTQQMRMKKSGS